MLRAQPLFAVISFTPCLPYLPLPFGNSSTVSQRGGRASYFDNINAAPEEAVDQSWNKYSAPVASGMKVGLV